MQGTFIYVYEEYIASLHNRTKKTKNKKMP